MTRLARVVAFSTHMDCGVCGASFARRMPWQFLCSPPCQNAWTAARHRRNSLRRYDELFRTLPRSCKDCSGVLTSPTPGGGPRWCDECRRQRAIDSNRRKNSKRRGARVDQSYSLQQIGNRDNWRCHLCGARVNKILSGLDPAGPTIDHLLPVSAGGTDERRNVALAHRQCNVNRRDGGLVQLRLVG